MYFIYITIWDFYWSFDFLHNIIEVWTYWFFVWHVFLETCAPCLLFKGMWLLMRVYIFPNGSFSSVICLNIHLFELQ